MAKLSDLDLKYQVFMKLYRYRRLDWRPGATLKKPLSEARVAMIRSAASYQDDQLPFDPSIRGGDYSYRVIPLETELQACA